MNDAIRLILRLLLLPGHPDKRWILMRALGHISGFKLEDPGHSTGQYDVRTRK